MDTLIALGTGLAFKVSALTWIASKRHKEYVGVVSKIFVYPLKSAKHLSNITNVMLTKHGLRINGISDRHWVVTKNGQRQNMSFLPKLISIRTSIEKEALRLDAPEMEPLVLPIHPRETPENVVTIYVKEIPQTAIDCGDKAAEWMCKALGKDKLRLNCSPKTIQKRLSHKVTKEWPTEVQLYDEVAFQDFVTCMVMSESSMEALNKRLEKPIPAVQFRPNLMIEGSKPFDEESWQRVFIGDKAEIRFVDKCTRCIIVTMDPETGVRDKQNQPLTEMKKFRCMEPYGPLKPVMGIHTAVETEGKVKVGDPVYVIRK